MEIGIHQLVWLNRWDKEKLDYLDRVKEMGYDAMDIIVRSLDIQTAKSLKERAGKIGLRLIGGGSLPVGQDLLSDDPDRRRASLDYLKGLIRTAHELGANFYGGVIYSTMGKLVGRGPSEAELGYLVDALREAARYAAAYGIDLGLEAVNRYETYVLNTASQTIDLIKRVGEPNVGVFLDTYHMNIEEKNFYDPVVEAKGRLLHVHLCENDRGIPGTGHVNWEEIFKALKDVGYDRVASIETFLGNLPEVAAATCIWRELSPGPEVLAREGLSFLRTMCKKYGL